MDKCAVALEIVVNIVYKIITLKPRKMYKLNLLPQYLHDMHIMHQNVQHDELIAPLEYL